MAALLTPPTSASDPTRLLKWFSLEPASPNTVPGFSWDLTPSATPGVGGTAVLRLDSGWRLYLTDQPPRAPSVPGIDPLGVLATKPALTITGGGSQPLTINIATTPPATSAPGPGATYSYQSSSGVESLTVTSITTVYDPVNVAQIVRDQYGVGAPASALLGPATPATAAGTPAPGSPESAAGGVPPVLWAFVPLEDGWAQLPVVNLTEQTILDRIAPPTAPSTNPVTGLFTGAASFGNDRAELYPLTGGREQPWNLTILDALSYAGSISLTGGGTSDNWVISQVQLTLDNPELDLNGFLWLGTTPPTAADALPDFVNWLACLERISLRTMRDVETFPSPFVLAFASIAFSRGAAGPHAEATASLGQWQFTYNGNSAKVAVPSGSAPVFVILWPTVTGGKPVWTYQPLVWRRHPSSPAIQSLPLTQSASPPNYPSPSRQLAPFELEVDTNGFPSGWTFQAAGATSWPVLFTAANPAHDWAALGGLPLASLGLPGLTFDPSELPGLIAQNANLAFLNAQYRYGLPYLDEVHALSTPPREDPQSGDTTDNLPPSTTDNLPPPVLLRENYADHWSRLSTLAFFAGADADQVLAPADGKNASNGVVAAGAFEPFLWPVTVSLDLATSPYPGKLTLTDTGSGQAMVLDGDPNFDALGGLNGLFSVASGSLQLLPPPAPPAPPPAGSFAVLAGSVGAVEDSSNRLRDQRGLSRAASVVGTSGTVVKTDLQLEGGDAVRYYSALASLEIDLGSGSGGPWRFWFRDVPSTAGTKPGSGFTFDRAKLPRPRSGAARTIRRRCRGPSCIVPATSGAYRPMVNPSPRRPRTSPCRLAP